jgi:hypothetical protein
MSNYLATSACEKYARDFGTRYRPFRRSLPDCSVMLATDKKVYLVMTFKDWIDARDATVPGDLARTIGQTFAAKGYEGEVIVKSDWFGSSPDIQRVYVSYSLSSLEFAYQEMTSGVRTESAAIILLGDR